MMLMHYITYHTHNLTNTPIRSHALIPYILPELDSQVSFF